jgi:unsaturated chondroitin disaccharide hydrolase
MLYCVSEEETGFYKGSALKILKSLTENYGTWDQSDHQAVLCQGTSNKPLGRGINSSLIYGDYYYLEALAKLMGWKHRIF